MTTERRRRLLLVLFAGAALYAVTALWLWQWRPRVVTGHPAQDGYSRAAGVIHVHTTFSDGTGSPADVVAAARAAGVKFVMITDHNNADAKTFEGYHDGVLVLVGSELSTRDGHILGLGIAEPAYRFSGDAYDGLEDIQDLGGVPIAAHPMSPRQDLRFTGWELPGAWGLELLNGDSAWRTAKARLLPALISYPVNQRYAMLQLLQTPADVLARWDALLSVRDVVGVAGADAHGSYEATFGVVQNHVLLPSPPTGRVEDDRAAVLDAVRRGRLYVGVDGFADAANFSFVAVDGDTRVTMGDTIAPSPTLRLQSSGALPPDAEIVLLRNGRRITAGQSLDVAGPGAGVYRVEVRAAGLDVPWILTNPIYVFDPRASTAREEKSTRKTPLDATAPPRPADRSCGTVAFKPASDSQSTVDAAVLDPHGGREGHPAIRMAFRLGTAPNVFAALADFTSRDCRGYSGISFSVRADGVYRMWVQVRDQASGAADASDWWNASVRTATGWKSVRIPFARAWQITSPKRSGALDAGKIRALILIVDGGSMKPGTGGTIWVQEPEFY